MHLLPVYATAKTRHNLRQGHQASAVRGAVVIAVDVDEEYKRLL